MGDRSLKFHHGIECDVCGDYESGVWDIYGDYICEACLSKNEDEFEQELDFD